MKSSCTAASVKTFASAARIGALVGTLCFSHRADAQSNNADLALAQALFEEGRTLMAALRYDDACPKFDESRRIDPASGTLLNLALCHEKQGKTATAWAEYNDVVATSRKERNAERQQLAAQRIREIEPRLCHLSIESPAGPIPGTLTVAVDGVELRTATWGMAIPVDPGQHSVEVRVQGKKTWSGTVTLARDGSSSVLTVVPVHDGPESKTDPSVPREGTSPRNDHKWAYIFGATGVVALGFGTYFGLRAKSEWDDRNAHCAGGICDEQAVSASRNAHALALGADISFGLGILGVGLAAYVLVTSGLKSKTAAVPIDVWVDPERRQFAVQGHF